MSGSFICRVDSRALHYYRNRLKFWGLGLINKFGVSVGAVQKFGVWGSRCTA